MVFFIMIFNNCFHIGDQIEVNNLNILNLLPDSRHYMTYDGSLTQPGCQETVRWIIMNRPIIVDRNQVSLHLCLIICTVRAIFNYGN